MFDNIKIKCKSKENQPQNAEFRKLSPMLKYHKKLQSYSFQIELKTALKNQ